MRQFSKITRSAACLIAPVAFLLAGPVMAVPPDPQRPFEALDCPSALARLTEALTGNPLISAKEAADVLGLARAQAQRLCTEDDLLDVSRITPQLTPNTDPAQKPETE